MSKLGLSGDPNAPHLGGWVNDRFESKFVGEVGTYCPDVWDFLIEKLNIKNYLDIGCGIGASLEYMKNRGLNVTGIEGDKAAIECSNETIRNNIICHDYNKGPALKDTQFELCYSSEFVEHVSEKYIRNYLSDMSLCLNVLITYAQPGQSGYHHVNCKQRDYWIGVMAATGFYYNDDMTEKVKNLAQSMVSGNKGQPCCWFGARTFLFFSKFNTISINPNDRIFIHKAEYGTSTNKIDVTDLISRKVNELGGRNFEMNVTNEEIGQDPVFGQVKALIIEWSLSSDKTKIFTTRALENSFVTLEL